MTNAEIIATSRVEIESRIKELHEAEIDYREDQCDAIVSCLVSGISELQRVLTFLNTLEKSLTAKVVDDDGLNREIERYFDGWSDDSEYGQAVMRDGACVGVDECKDIARHFDDLGCRRTAEKYDEIEYNRQRAEESVSENLKEELSRFFAKSPIPYEHIMDWPLLKNTALHFAKWGAEHGGSSEIPKDLDAYAQSVEDYYDVGEERGYLCTHRGDIKDAVIAGAKWQKQHDAELIEIAYNDGITIGMTKQKEQMMKEAVEGIVENWSPEPHPEITIPLNPEEYSNGDKVRVIIVKED